MSKKEIFFRLFLLSVWWCQDAFAYDDEFTHRQITDFATQKSIINSNKYLSNNLGGEFSDEYKTIIDGKKIIEWLQDGSKLEDAPLCRASSHFLNPLKTWNEAALSDMKNTFLGAGINEYCLIRAPFDPRYVITKYSNVTWATGQTSPTSAVSNNDNDMDWNAAKAFYKLALTDTDYYNRQEHFAKTFQSLGQVIHLIQDMAVPAHVRNDFTAHLALHKVPIKLENISPTKWVGNSYEWMVKDIKNSYLITPLMQNVSSSYVVSPVGNRLTAFWDANIYNAGSNPSTSLAQGLAEYTNGNYFSASTIFAEEKDSTDIHYFPRPAKSDSNAAVVELAVSDGQTDRVRYVTKTASGDKLAAYSFLTKWVETTDAGSSVWASYQKIKQEGWEYNLDDDVYKDYAKKLIPRAVGYSAGLINYFFRGELDMVKDANGPGYIIHNKSSDEMVGTCTLYYDYENEDRTEVPGTNWPCNIAAGGETAPVSFTTPYYPVPKTMGEYMLVFEGRLGNEEDAVIGKFVKFDAGPRARAVSINRYGSAIKITVNTDSGLITGFLPSDKLDEVRAVRFDQSDWNTFVVLATHYSDSSGQNGVYIHNVFHKYSIDESSMELIYQGIVKEDPHASFTSVRSELDREHYHSDQDVAIVEVEIKWVSNIYVDFYLDSSLIIPLAVNRIESYSLVYQTECNSSDENCFGNGYRYDLGYKYFIQSYELKYGGFNELRVTTRCEDGSYSKNQGFTSCTHSPGEPFIMPLAIFNNKDFAYIDGPDVKSTLPVEFPQYVNTNRYIHTMLREAGKYSFYTGRRYNPYQSFSSEIGQVNCGYLLMTDKKDGDSFIGWRNGNIISFNTCSDWKTLKSGWTRTSSSYIFDVIFK